MPKDNYAAIIVNVGDTVRCRFFNSVEGVFYEDPWDGEVVGINLGRPKPINVRRIGYGTIWMHRYEIMAILSEVAA